VLGKGVALPVKDVAFAAEDLEFQIEDFVEFPVPRSSSSGCWCSFSFWDHSADRIEYPKRKQNRRTSSPTTDEVPQTKTNEGITCN
jgi:hypothetical protein